MGLAGLVRAVAKTTGIVRDPDLEYLCSCFDFSPSCALSLWRRLHQNQRNAANPISIKATAMGTAIAIASIRRFMAEDITLMSPPDALPPPVGIVIG